MYEDDEEEIRTFSVSEARSLIPRLRRLMARLAAHREVLLRLTADVDRARENAEKNGGSFKGPAYIAHLTAFSAIIQEIHALGVQVKDFQAGLVDFPHEHEGRIVYLCWKPDEDDLRWWHEVDAGFAGRQLLTDDFE
ncbi:MAG TPA: DUF2203 domain-containing protein [Blastocatellia bacterium]|nr:DUF2203 domain-containing protein [Blastocatellia bacterium]